METVDFVFQMVHTWNNCLQCPLSANQQRSISGWGAEWPHGKGGRGCRRVLLYKSHQDGFQVRLMPVFLSFPSVLSKSFPLTLGWTHLNFYQN